MSNKQGRKDLCLLSSSSWRGFIKETFPKLYMIPEVLFRYLSTYYLPAKNDSSSRGEMFPSSSFCSFHEFMSCVARDSGNTLVSTLSSSSSSSSNTFMIPKKFTCKNCFIHLKVCCGWVEKSRAACKTCHFVLVKQESDFDGNGKYLELECDYCRISWAAEITPRIIKHDILGQLLLNKDASAQATCLFMLEFYTANIYHGNPKPINSENPKFKQFIGINDISLQIISLIGYTLVGSHFQPNGETVGENRVELLLQELSLFRYLRSQGAMSNPSIFTFSDATFSLCDMIGIKCNASTAKVYLDSFKGMISSTPLCFLRLGCTKNASDAVIISSFESLRKANPSKIPLYMDNFLEVVQAKQSSVLEEYLVTERSKGAVSLKELTHAYKVLGGVDDETPSRKIIEIFKYALMAKKSSLAELTDALQLICTHRDCATLEYWLKNGQLPPFFNSMELDPVDLPAGLYNIGNTCYVNPVFQFLFSLSALRSFLLSYKIPENIDLSALSDYEKKSAHRAFSFIKLFQELFVDLLFSNDMVVTPKKQLIQLILNDTDGNLFGMQQDITETMDQILIMFSLILKVQGISMTDTSPFYGKEVQTITYTTKDGEVKVLRKETGYRNIIIDMNPNLTEALDNYYGKQQVEYENVVATKELSISQFPTFVSIRINRLSFDRERQLPVKSNEFIKFPKELRLGRFSAGKEAEKDERQVKLKNLMCQMEKKKALLLGLTAKKHRKSAPIDLLSQSARVVAEDYDLAFQLNALSQEVGSLIEATNISLNEIEREIDALKTDASGRPYLLVDVFMHDGEANFGHYWHYGWDPQYQRWLKYNDSVITVVDESEVLADTTGKSHNAIVLIYADAEHVENLVQPFVRTDAYREKWRHLKFNQETA